MTTDLEGQHSKMANGRHGNSVQDAGDGSTESLAHVRPVLSAIVFAYRNEATILQVVSSLVEQEFDEPFEVVVATSGGDRTSELVRQNFPGVRVIESPVRLMPGGARNLGMKLARVTLLRFSRRTASLARTGYGTGSPRTGTVTKQWRAPLRWRIPSMQQLGRQCSFASRTGWKGRHGAERGCLVRTTCRSHASS